MPKLCQCRRHEIENLIAGLHSCPDTGGISEEDVETDVSEIENILESDCVCEKKEFRQPCFYCPFVAVADSNDYCSTLIIAHNRICTENPSKKIQVKEPCTCDSKFSINGPVGHRPDCISQGKEKQSQSPCEHEPDEWNIYCKKCGYTFKKACLHAWEEKKIATYPYYGEDHVVVEDQWWCQKCGLVTCKNPNQE